MSLPVNQPEENKSALAHPEGNQIGRDVRSTRRDLFKTFKGLLPLSSPKVDAAFMLVRVTDNQCGSSRKSSCRKS
jgi:hypothetical protein